MTPALRLRGLLWMAAGETNFGGPGRISLLRAIRNEGSITHAARAMGMSYKAAWDAVDLMNRLAGEALVVRTPGGRGGGSTRLTERGEELIERYDEVCHLHQRFIDALDARSEGLRRTLETPGCFEELLLPGAAPPAREAQDSRLNRLAGTVRSVRIARRLAEIEFVLPGGNSIHARTERDEVHRLGLETGMHAVALFGVGSVAICKGQASEGLAARNRLAGIIARLERGQCKNAGMNSGEDVVRDGGNKIDGEDESENGIGGEADVVLALNGGGSVTATVSCESIGRLGLAAGVPAVAAFQASSVSVLPCPLAQPPGDQSTQT